MCRDVGAGEHYRSQEIRDADPDDGSLSPFTNRQESLQASTEQELFDNRLPDHSQEEGQGQNAMPGQRLDGHQERQHTPEGSSYGQAGEKNRGTIKAERLFQPKSLAQCRNAVGCCIVHISPRSPETTQGTSVG